jgi:benzoylformate decarboxylase
MHTSNKPETRWIRDYVFDALRDLEINYIFGVPGTNEIPIIDGCDIASNNVTYIQCLHESIAVGAAMGYARMTGKPGVVLLHATPGAGHGLGNLFNAWRSKIPIVILCGQQHSQLVTQEPLLASDTALLASQYTKWSHELRSWQETPLVLQRAFKEAMAPPTGPVFLSFPWEYVIHEIEKNYDEPLQVTRIAPRFAGDPAGVSAAARALAIARDPVIIVGDGAGYADASDELRELAELIGAPVYLEGQSGMADFPNSDYHWQGELPSGQTDVRDRLRLHDVAFMCGFGVQAQLTVFRYENGPLIPGSVKQIYLNNNTWDIAKNDHCEVAILGDIKATLPALNRLLRATPPAGVADRNTKLKAYSDKRSASWDSYLTEVRD